MIFSLCASLYRLAPLIIRLSLNPWRSGHGGRDGQPGSFPAIFDVSCKYISAGLHHTYHHLLIQATVELKDNQWIVIEKEWLEKLLLSDDSGRFEKQGFPVRVMLYQPKICTSASCLRAPGMWTAWNSNFFSIRFSPWRKEEGRSSKNMYKGPFPTTQIYMYEVFRLKITGACLYQL